MESGSESEANHHHHHHHRHRHSRKSTESLPHLEAEWRDIQHRVRDRGGTRGETCSNPGDIRQQNGLVEHGVSQSLRCTNLGDCSLL